MKIQNTGALNIYWHEISQVYEINIYEITKTVTFKLSYTQDDVDLIA